MKVKMLEGLRVPTRGELRHGEVYDLPDEHGRRLVATGKAEAVRNESSEQLALAALDKED